MLALVQRGSVIDSRNEQDVTSTPLWVAHLGSMIDPFSNIYLCIFAAFTTSIQHVPPPVVEAELQVTCETNQAAQP